MADGWKMKDGKGPYLEKLKRLAEMRRVYGAKTLATSSTGKIKRAEKHTQRGSGGKYVQRSGQAATHDEDASRSAGQNIIALRLGEKKGRLVTGVTAREREIGQQIWSAATSSYLRMGGSGEGLFRAAERIGKFLIQCYQIHIRQGSGAAGAFKPVTPRTQKTKDREGERPGLPPMWRTGQLMRSFVFEIVERD